MKVNFVRRFPSVEEGRAAKTIYMERAPGERYFTIYVTFEDPAKYASTIPLDEIGQLVAEFASGLKSSFAVNNIEERDALKTEGLLKADAIVLVKDATGDMDFKGSGGMAYFYSIKTEAFIPSFRMAEDPYAEAPWDEFHTHSNKEVLDRLDIEKDGEGNPVLVDGKEVLTYGGKRIAGILIDQPSW